MDGLRDDFLARTTLAIDQHRGCRGGDLLNHVADLGHQRRVADEVLKTVLERCIHIHGHRHRLMFLNLLFGALETGEDVVDLERLRRIVEHALLHRLDRRFNARIGGQKDDGHCGPKLLQLMEELHAVHGSHPQVGDRDVDTTAIHSGDGCGAFIRRLHLVSIGFEEALQQEQNARFIVDYQDF